MGHQLRCGSNLTQLTYTPAMVDISETAEGTRRFAYKQFHFVVRRDHRADPLWGIEILVWFRGEPCCDDNGHQYRLYLPLGVQNATVDDCCRAFCAARHCEMELTSDSS
jgi:hypothetical protein